MGKMRNEQKLYPENLNEKDRIGDLSEDGRIIF
jgi:hypothetical protein